MGVTGWCIQRVSRLLDAAEREVVLGDFAETKMSGLRALRELAGLTARRHAQMWMGWRPWAGLAVAGVGAMALRWWAIRYFAMFWIHVRTWRKYGVLYGTGLTPVEDALVLASQLAAVVAWCWAGGWVVGAIWRGRRRRVGFGSVAALAVVTGMAVWTGGWWRAALIKWSAG